MSALTYGIHTNVPEGRYHADDLLPMPTLSSSLARIIIGQSPLHAWTEHPRLNPDHVPKDRKTFDIGRAAHRAVMGRGGDYVAIPEDILAANGAASTTAAKEWIADARAAGLTPIKAAEVAQVETMAGICRQTLRDDYGIILNPERSEVTAIADIDGAICRARFDNLPDAPVMIPGVGPRKVIVDFKTTELATEDACTRSVEGYAYDVQGQWYRDVLRAATGEDRDMLFVFQEKPAPHAVRVVLLLREAGHSADFGQDAEEACAAARAVWRDCLAHDHWPSYAPGITIIGARPFHRQAWQDRAARLSLVSKPAAAALRAAYDAQSPRRIAGE